MAETIDSVFRDFNTPGNPGSGEYEPEKPRIRALLRQLQDGGGQSVTRGTLSALEAVIPPTENYGGVVLDDPTPANNGYYFREGGTWVKGRGFPDTFAEMVLTGGPNAQTGSVGPGVSPADVEIFWADVQTENDGPLTLDGLPVLNVAGNSLSAGEWTGVVQFVNRGNHWQLINDAGAAASAAQSASDAKDEADRSEAAADRAQNAASAVTSRAWFDYVSTLLSDDNDVVGYVGSGADFIVAAGDIITAGGFRFEVAASDAADEHEETAGGVKLYEAGPIYSSIERMARTGASVNGEAAIVTQDGRAGTFTWSGSDLSATLLSHSATSTAVDDGDDLITSVAHGLFVGDTVFVSDAVNGLSIDTPYYVIVPEVQVLRIYYETAAFTVGQTVTGAGGATATIDRIAMWPGPSATNNVGYLYVSNVVGDFVNNETITDPLGGSARVASGNLSTIFDPDNFQLATSYANAMAGTPLSLTGTTNFTVSRLRDPEMGIYVTTPDDPTGENGAWVRDVAENGDRMATWFGLDPDGTKADNRRALQGAFHALGRGCTLIVAPGSYLCDGPLFLEHSRFEFHGSAVRLSARFQTEYDGSFITVNPAGNPGGQNNATFVRIKDFEFHQVGTAYTGTAVDFNDVSHGFLENCRARDFNYGFTFKTKNNFWFDKIDLIHNNTGIIHPIFYATHRPQQVYFRDVRSNDSNNWGIQLQDSILAFEFSDLVFATPETTGGGIQLRSGNWKGPNGRWEFSRMENENFNSTSPQQTIVQVQDIHGVTGDTVLFNSCLFNNSESRGLRLDNMTGITIVGGRFNQQSGAGGRSIDTTNSVADLVLLNVREQDEAARFLGTDGLTKVPA